MRGGGQLVILTKLFDYVIRFVGLHLGFIYNNLNVLLVLFGAFSELLNFLVGLLELVVRDTFLDDFGKSVDDLQYFEYERLCSRGLGGLGDLDHFLVKFRHFALEFHPLRGAFRSDGLVFVPPLWVWSLAGCSRVDSIQLW